MSDHIATNLRRKPSEPPEPDASALRLSEALVRQIRDKIDQLGGRLPFDNFMELALYAPGLGYYVAGSRKFGEAGDFVTAPEISPLFSRCIADQAAQVMDELQDGDLLEFGAGSGVMAADLLLELKKLNSLPGRYLILEVSPELQQRQRQTLADKAPGLLDRIVWLDRLPEGFRGMVVANELVDAMPVNRFRLKNGMVEECFVSYDEEGFYELFDKPVSAGLEEAVVSAVKAFGELPSGYVSEINLRQAGWLKALSESMEQGAVLLIDYGYPRHEFYHPERATGTLMCHYRHRAHADPFRWVGLQDITSHVDFTALAQSGVDAGFKVSGYTTQAHFLMGSGLDRLMRAANPEQTDDYMRLAQKVKQLVLPSEMGERFKVLGLTKGMRAALKGFTQVNLKHRL